MEGTPKNMDVLPSNLVLQRPLHVQFHANKVDTYLVIFILCKQVSSMSRYRPFSGASTEAGELQGLQERREE